MEIAIAIVALALCGWDIGRRALAGQRKSERAESAAVAEAVKRLEAKQAEQADIVARHDRQLTDLRGTRVEPRRPHLSGVTR